MQIFTHPQNDPTDKTAYRQTVKHVCSLALHKYVDVRAHVLLGKHTNDNNNQTEPNG